MKKNRGISLKDEDVYNDIYEPEKKANDSLRKRKEYIYLKFKELGFLIDKFSKEEREEIVNEIIEFYEKNFPNESISILKLKNTSKNNNIIDLKNHILYKYIKKSGEEINIEDEIKKYIEQREIFLKKINESARSFDDFDYSLVFYERIFNYLSTSKFYLETLRSYILTDEVEKKINFENFKTTKEDVISLYMTQMNSRILDKIIIYIEYSFSNIYFSKLTPIGLKRYCYDIFNIYIKEFKERVSTEIENNNILDGKCDIWFLSFLEFQDSKSIYKEEIDIWEKCNTDEVNKKINNSISRLFNIDVLETFSDTTDLYFENIRKTSDQKYDDNFKLKRERIKKLVEIFDNLDGGIIIPKNKVVFIVLYDVIYNEKLKVRETVLLRIKKLIELYENKGEISHISNEDKKYLEVILFKILYRILFKNEEEYYFFEIKKALLEIVELFLKLNNPKYIQKELINLINLLIQINENIFTENRYYRGKYELNI